MVLKMMLRRQPRTIPFVIIWEPLEQRLSGLGRFTWRSFAEE
jgi:hypothetical protein